MIYVLRPQMPGLFEVIDAVLDGPPGWATGEGIRHAFGKDMLQKAQSEGRALAEDDLKIEPFLEWLGANGFKVLAFEEIDSIVDPQAVANWNARVVTPPDVAVHDIAPSEVPANIRVVGEPGPINFLE